MTSTMQNVRNREAGSWVLSEQSELSNSWGHEYYEIGSYNFSFQATKNTPIWYYRIL